MVVRREFKKLSQSLLNEVNVPTYEGYTSREFILSQSLLNEVNVPTKKIISDGKAISRNPF